MITGICRPKIGSHVSAAVHIFGVSSLLAESVRMYMYIFKTDRGNKCVREKSDIKFLYWKETSYGNTKETHSDLLRYLIYLIFCQASV